MLVQGRTHRRHCNTVPRKIFGSWGGSLFPTGATPQYWPPLFHRERSVETVRLMTPITERLSARATTATERVRFALGCGHVVAVTVAQGNLPIYP